MLPLASNQGATNEHREMALLTPCARETQTDDLRCGQAWEKGRPWRFWGECPLARFPGECDVMETQPEGRLGAQTPHEPGHAPEEVHR